MRKERMSTLSKNVLERLELNKSFILLVKKARAGFGIPLNGFKSDNNYIAWLLESGDKNNLVKKLTKQSEIVFPLVCEGARMLKKETGNFIDSPTIFRLIEDYFIFGDTNNIKHDSWAHDGRQHLLEYPSIGLYDIKNLDVDKFIHIKENNPDGAIITLHPYITKDELMKFVRKCYKNIRIVMRSTKRPPRLRKYVKTVEYKAIFLLWKKYFQKPISELRIIAKNPHFFSKYEAIAFLLKRDHNIDVKTDALRTIVSRMKKRETICDT